MRAPPHAAHRFCLHVGKQACSVSLYAIKEAGGRRKYYTKAWLATPPWSFTINEVLIAWL
jgi:hypothetical protein